MTYTVVNGKTYKIEKVERTYTVERGQNGYKYVTKESVVSYHCNISEGNSKTGPALNFNLSIEYTCDHRCECYKMGMCYACGGCYQWAKNQAMYTENYNYFKTVSSTQFVATLQMAIDETGYKLFRFFTCGDIPNSRFLDCMVELARQNPGVAFWAYTKKYSIVNAWIAANGPLPENLHIIFSHWRNDDGSYFPMENPYNLPTSEFIPFGMEELAETVTHICPCSDPNVKVTCATCDHACYTLKPGESMALLEHSTKRTSKRDKAIKAAKDAIK